MADSATYQIPFSKPCISSNFRVWAISEGVSTVLQDLLPHQPQKKQLSRSNPPTPTTPAAAPAGTVTGLVSDTMVRSFIF